MASIQPHQVLKTQLLKHETQEQSLKWDAEATLYEFECALDALDLMTDGLPDDPRTSNALNGLHDILSKIHADIKAEILPDNIG